MPSRYFLTAQAKLKSRAKPRKYWTCPGAATTHATSSSIPPGKNSLSASARLRMSTKKESTKKTRDEQRFWKQILTEPVCASLPAACATLSAWTGSRRRRLYGLSSPSAPCSALRRLRLISRRYETGHLIAGRIPTVDRTQIHAKRDSGRNLAPRLASRTTRPV